MKTPESSTSAMRLFISSSRGAYCARTSTSGVCGTASQSTRPPTPDQEPDPARHKQTENGVIHVMEVLVEGFPVAPDGPADAREREAPGGGADEGEHRVPAERHAEDAGRDGDERTRHGRNPADQRGGVAPAVEPALRLLEPLRPQVQPAPVSVEIRPAAVHADRPAA